MHNAYEKIEQLKKHFIDNIQDQPKRSSIDALIIETLDDLQADFKPDTNKPGTVRENVVGDVVATGRGSVACRGSIIGGTIITGDVHR